MTAPLDDSNPLRPGSQDPPRPEGQDPPVSLLKILQENPFLVRMLIFFFLMLFVPLVLAWKFDWFLIAN